MSTSKATNNKLAVQLATDRRYKIQKNGVIKKLRSDGKYAEVGTERHGYNVVSYKGTKIVTARAVAAKILVELYGFDTSTAAQELQKYVMLRKNGTSLDDSMKNLRAVLPKQLTRGVTKRLSQKQIDTMVGLFCEGYSVAKIARRFRRKISRSHVSRVIRKELGIETVGA